MFRSLALLLALLAFSPAVLAQTAPDATVQDDGQGPVSRLIEALHLQAKAEAAQDALALAQAADMAMQVQLRAAVAPNPKKVKHKLQSSIPSEATDAASLPPGAALVFLQSGEAMGAAMLMAEGDDALMDVLEPLAGSAGWHQTSAATQAEAELAPNTAQEWELAFDGQSPAEISVLSLGPGPALWQVEDADGEVVCPAKPAETPQICRFTPEVNSYFRVIVAAGKLPSALRYLLLTN